jgi:N-hydroxyarylamine O-acetyltransferase
VLACWRQLLPDVEGRRLASSDVVLAEEHSMDVDAYLERIHYRGPLTPTAGTLRQLQVAHLRAVPFENLSIHRGEPIELDDEALFEKIVVRRRGGFCYELNGLFAALLRALGFDVAMLSAGVMTAAGTFGPDFDHMTLLVPLAERWLADVGFGDSFLEPLLLDERGEQVQGRRAYRVDAGGDERLTLLQRGEGGEWAAQYRFGLEPHVYADYAEMCHFHQTSPASHFTQRRVCSLATPEGRMTLSEMRLITTRDGERQERELAGEREYAEALREHFAIALPG